MLREMSKMSVEEAFDWASARRTEIMARLMSGDISEQVSNSLLDWVNESLSVYLVAVANGHIVPDQVEGTKGGRNERR